jgi:hypothetical protein
VLDSMLSDPTTVWSIAVVDDAGTTVAAVYQGQRGLPVWEGLNVKASFDNWILHALVAGRCCEIRVFRNGALWAEIPANIVDQIPPYVMSGDEYYVDIYVSAHHLICEEDTKPIPKCTCGVRGLYGGGLCSDWCDLVRS